MSTYTAKISTDRISRRQYFNVLLVFKTTQIAFKTSLPKNTEMNTLIIDYNYIIINYKLIIKPHGRNMKS